MGLLSPEFLNKYENIEPRNKGPLFEVVYLRTYSRYLDKEKRRETWLETIQRVVEHSLSLYPKDGPASQEQLIQEAELMFDKIFHLEVLPAGRSLWIAGTEGAKKQPSSLFNCSYIDIDSLECFSEIFQLLLNGCGVGFGVRKDDIKKLAKLHLPNLIWHDTYKPKHPIERVPETTVTSSFCELRGIVYHIDIGDSREGWVEALRQFFFILTDEVSSYWQIIINYDSVRPAGERIKTFGGRAPGPDGLREMFINLEKIISKSQGKLSPLNCIDIANHIAKNVIVGGTRRSSEVALGDEDDTEFIEAKKDLWVSKENLQRTMSNNSIIFNTKPSKEKLSYVFDNIANNGEPGFYNYEAVLKKCGPTRRGSNPCKPLNSLILTPQGYITFKQALKKKQLEVVLGNGEIVKASKPFKTDHLPVNRILLSNGSYLYATDNHLHQNENGKWVETKNLKPGDKLKYTCPSVHSLEIKNKEEETLGILAGWIHGDGSMNYRSDGTGFSTGLCFGDKEFDIIPFFEDYFGKKAVSHSQKPNTCKVLNSHAVKLPKIFLERGMTFDKTNLEWLYTQPKDFKLGFIKAVFTADGSVRKQNSVELYSTRRTALEVISNILREFGIHNSINLHNNARSYIAKDLKMRNNSTIWKINVYSGQFKRIGLLSKFKQDKLNTQQDKKLYRPLTYLYIKHIDWGWSKEDVYDISVNHQEHYYIDSSIYSHNCMEVELDSRQFCNLSSVVIASHIDEKGRIDFNKLKESFKLAARIGLRHTNTTVELPEWDYKQKRDRLLGVSFTGLMDAVDQLGGELEIFDIQQWKRWTKKEARRYAHEMRVPEPLLTTCVKPEGTLTLLTKSLSPGVHRSYAPYYIRRIRVSSMDPVAQALQALGVPFKIDPGKAERLVFEFSIKSTARTTLNEESAKDQYKRYLTIMKNYADHNVSITININKEEIPEIIDMVYDNWDDTIACAWLPKDTTAYPLMPYEEITREEYLERFSKMPDLNRLSALVNELEKEYEEQELIDDECKSGACPVR